jgi:hypothetical protein
MLTSKMLRKMQKFADKKVTGKGSVQNWSLSSSILLTCVSFWQITFLDTSSNYLHVSEISVKFCVFLIVIC